MSTVPIPPSPLPPTPQQWILVTGNVVDGFTFAGPFPTEETAADQGFDDETEWCTAELVSPNDPHFKHKVWGTSFVELFGETWQVVVGNVGTVYSGDSETVARDKYRVYVDQSLHGSGRAGGEPVHLLHNGEVVACHDFKPE